MTEGRPREKEATNVEADFDSARHPCCELASRRGPKGIDRKHTCSGLEVVSIDIGNTPGFGNRHTVGASIDESHRVARTDGSLYEHPKEIADQPSVLGRDRKIRVPVSRRNLVARCARLSHLDHGRTDLKNITEMNVSLDETGNREVLPKCTGHRQVETQFTPVRVVLERIHQSRHVRTAMVFVHMLVSGESKLTQSERTVDGCLDECRLNAAPPERQCTHGADTHGTNVTDEFNHHASERSSRDR